MSPSMTSEVIRCASIPEAELCAARRPPREAGDLGDDSPTGRAWIVWDHLLEPDATRPVLVERLLAIAGVEVFARREGRWHRPGESLPAFDLPGGDRPVRRPARSLDRPRSTRDHPAAVAIAPRPMGLRLVAGRSRPRSARVGYAVPARCPAALGRPVAVGLDRVGARGLAGARGRPAGSAPDRAVASIAGRRGWRPVLGAVVLVPLGYRVEPDLGERALREVAGAGEGDLVVVDDGGLELIPVDAFRTLRRATIRLAAAGRGGSP